MITDFFKPQTCSNSAPTSPLSSLASPVSSLASPVDPFEILDNDNRLTNSDLKSDPAERTQILKLFPNKRDRVRRYYIQKGPCQPVNFTFPIRDFGGTPRHFNRKWFKKPPYSHWLEYNDAAYCLCCYLFKNEIRGYGKVSDSFTTKGFRSWNKALERLKKHVGETSSVHACCFKMMLDLMNQNQSILTSFDKQSKKIKGEYRIRLNASIDVIRYLLKEGMPFRGHNEGVNSTKRAHFLNLLKWYADRKEEVKNVVLEKAPKNNSMTSPDIQKDIVNACAKETVKSIIEDLNGDYFGILVDESKDVSHKEQMALVLRYVNKEGKIERFLGLVHVNDTSAKSLKEAIYSLLLDNSLSRSQIRGQGYDGASNMQGELNGLKTLILKDNSSAYCIHFFAHQLQLTLVAVGKKHRDVNNFFDILSNVLNIVGGSSKRREMLRRDQAEKLEELLMLGEVHTGSGLNQKLGLQRPGDTRWGSHFKTVRNFISLFSSIVYVLEVLENEGVNYHEKAMAKGVVGDIKSYEFIYILHLMLKILAITYDLNMALQRKDQDIVTAMKLVDLAKKQLQSMRESK